MLRKIQVRESKFLGTPAIEGRIVREIYTPVGQHYYVVVAPDMPGEFEVDTDGTILIGPPNNGWLVRAP